MPASAQLAVRGKAGPATLALGVARGLAATPAIRERRIVRSTVRARLDSGQVLEGGEVSSDHLSLGGACGRGDHKIMRSAGFALAANLHEERGVGLGDLGVIANCGDCCSDIVQKGLSRCSSSPLRDENAHKQLRNSDRRYSYVIVVFDDLIQGCARAIGIDEEGR